MKTAAHTPGPWTLAEVKDGGIEHLCPIGANGYSVLTVVNQDGRQFGAVYREADARLIASAPDLLAMLIAVMKAPTGGINDYCPIKARALIAKATGASA